jgi:hypothetical protein
LRETVDRLMAEHAHHDMGLYGRMLDRRLQRGA